MAKNKWLFNVLCIVTVLTNLSQLPIFVENGITGYVSYACWGVLAVCVLMMRSKIDRRVVGIGIFFVGIILALGIMTIVAEKNYYNTRIFSSLIISVGVLVISHLIPREALDTDGEGIYKVYYSYIFSATVVAIIIYFMYFGAGFSFENGIYEYGSKNSTSQIVITAIVLALFSIRKHKKILNIITVVSLFINIVLLFLMRSRASIVGLAVIILMVLINRNVNKWVRIATLAATVIFVLVVLLNADVYDVIVNDILFASRDSTDISDLSSGRSDQWAAFPKLFAEHPFIGRGRYKIESFPLSVLAQYGMFVGGAIIIYALYPAIFAFFNRRTGIHHYILLALCLIYLLNGIFEELSPFGPGVKCYFIWFMFGILLRSSGNGKQKKLSNAEAR